tara:strand:- start:833 stop:955 length:123 start_codon:yes stop_codon:yes gene_type:complete
MKKKTRLRNQAIMARYKRRLEKEQMLSKTLSTPVKNFDNS